MRGKHRPKMILGLPLSSIRRKFPIFDPWFFSLLLSDRRNHILGRGPHLSSLHHSAFPILNLSLPPTALLSMVLTRASSAKQHSQPHQALSPSVPLKSRKIRSGSMTSRNATAIFSGRHDVHLAVPTFVYPATGPDASPALAAPRATTNTTWAKEEIGELSFHSFPGCPW